MPNDTKHSHSSDQHRLWMVHPVFILNTVWCFPIELWLKFQWKKHSLSSRAHYSGPSIVKPLLKAPVQLTSQYYSGIRDFFPPKGKACLCRKQSLLRSWSESVKWTPLGMKNHHKSSNLSQSIHLSFLFNKHLTYIKKKKKVLGYTAHTILPQG